jgi:Tol biopolymer transport system component
LSYPEGQFRLLTSDTNDYLHPSVSADGKMLVATQRQIREEISVTSSDAPSDWHPLTLSTREIIFRWNWTADGRLILPQISGIRVVNPAGGETVVFSDQTRLADQVASCEGGKTVVYRQFGHNGAAINVFRMDISGANQKQLTFGQNEAEPQCSSDPKWVYFVDRADNGYIKRVPLEGGATETVVKAPLGDFDLSGDGKKIVTMDVREEDHALVTRIDSIDDHQTKFYELDQRAGGGLRFAHDAKSVVFVVREKGVDNLWTQPLDGSPARQITHFTADQIYGYRYSLDGSKLAIERGHQESDAVLLRDTSGN